MSGQTPKIFGKIHCLVDQQLQMLISQISCDTASGIQDVPSLELGIAGFSIGVPVTGVNFTASVPRSGFEFIAGQNGNHIGNVEIHTWQIVVGTYQLTFDGAIKTQNVSQSTGSHITVQMSVTAIGSPEWVKII